MQDSFMRWPQVRAATGLSRTTVWRLEATGQFPKRRKLGQRSVAWLQSEIAIYIESRAIVGRSE